MYLNLFLMLIASVMGLLLLTAVVLAGGVREVNSDREAGEAVDNVTTNKPLAKAPERRES